MFLRAYRLTDKLSLALLKIAAGFGDWLLGSFESTGTILGLAGGFVLSLILGLGAALLRLLRAILVSIGRVAQMILSLLKQILRVGGRSVASGVVVAGSATGVLVRDSARRTGSAATQSMARRTARAELDTAIAVDPVIVQNRRLNVLVVVLGVALLGLILWATDPARSARTAPLIDEVGGNPALLGLAEPTAESVSVVGGIATPIPTATQLPAALQVRGSLAYVVRERGQTDIWVLPIAGGAPLRLLNDIVDERDPAWSPLPGDTRLAFASRQDGNWELYIYDLTTQVTSRLTYDLSFQGNPKWSPDAEWIVYESYQGNNLDVYAVRVDGSQAPIRITDHPAPDFSPAWSPSGREIAFVSLRDRAQDIFVFNLDTLETRNVTNTPLVNEDHPTWSPDGRHLAYSAIEQGAEKVFVRRVDILDQPAQVISFGRTPAWSPDGNSLVFVVDAVDGTASYLYVHPFGREGAVATEVYAVPLGTVRPDWTAQSIPPVILNSGGSDLSIREELYVEQIGTSTTGASIGLQSLPDVQAQRPFLSDAVNDSFNALRAHVIVESGRDFLGQLDDAWWDLERRPEPGEDRRNWHMTGRAFSVARSAVLGFPPTIEVIREDLGIDTYWRVYLRVSEDLQAGQLGEPLRRLPWDFLSRTEGDVEAFNQGGRLRADVPTGYYIDLTLLANDYDWGRRAAGTDWRANSNSINYWFFYRPDGLDWYSAMREIYLESQLGGFNPTPVPQVQSGG